MNTIQPELIIFEQKGGACVCCVGAMHFYESNEQYLDPFWTWTNSWLERMSKINQFLTSNGYTNIICKGYFFDEVNERQIYKLRYK